MRARMRAVLHAAREEGCDCVVLGAFGCGAFRNPAGQVAACYVRELGRRHLRTELLSIVPQEPALLAGSLRDNLAVGKPDASDAPGSARKTRDASASARSPDAPATASDMLRWRKIGLIAIALCLNLHYPLLAIVGAG